MPGITGGPVNQADHRWLAQDDLRDGVIQNIAAYLGQAPVAGAIGSGLRYANTSAVAIAATETLIAAVPLVLPATVVGQSVPGTLQPGSFVRATFNGTYTSAGAQTAVFTIRSGTLGTTGDASIATVSLTTAGSGSAIPFTVTIMLNIRTLGASGTLAGGFTLINKGTTGIFTAVADAETIASSTIATTTSTFLDFSLTAGTSNSASIVAWDVEVLP